MESRGPGSRSGIGRQDNGQGLVEFSLMIPIVMLLLIVFLELAFALNAYVTVVYAARQGARAGAVYLFQMTDCPAGSTDEGRISNDSNRESGTGCTTPYTENIVATVAAALNIHNRPGTSPNVIYDPITPDFPNRPGGVVKVTINYPYHFMLSFLPINTVTLSGTASQKIEY